MVSKSKIPTKNSSYTLLDEGSFPILVNSEVVKHLSVGLYRNFARAVKELISNSYDADATEVKIKLNLSNNSVIIRDNGYGMDLDSLKNNFFNIAKSSPISYSVDELGRSKIGAFGIGFLGTFPYCKEFELITKKKGEDKVIEITLVTDKYFQGSSFQIAKDESVHYKISKSDLPLDVGETIITLKEIAPHIIQDLKIDHTGNVNIDKMGGFEKFKWTLAQYSPIQFPEDRKDLIEFFADSQKVPLRIWLNSDEIFRNVPENAIILEKGTKTFGEIELKYAIMTPSEPVKPSEAKGLQIRLRDVAIGFPRDFEVGKYTGKVLGKLNYICGEIHILTGLESALMIDRDSFSYTEQVFEFENFFRDKIVNWNETLEEWAKGDKEIYGLLKDLKDSEQIITEFKDANLLHFSKERLRLPKTTQITKSKDAQKTGSVHKRVKEVFTKQKGYTIDEREGVPTQNESPIRIIPEEKKVIIFENHPSFTEEIKVKGKSFKVNYLEWDPSSKPYSICKFGPNENEVIFNTNHPIFKSQLSDEIAKKISLGIVLIAKNREDSVEIIEQFNRLLEEVFLGS
ncbi:MAG: ATP-binding protein [Methanoregula sp.]|jgi:hypothetical protein|nr:ATP-binding protein [Methanoregula sp.]